MPVKSVFLHLTRVWLRGGRWVVVYAALACLAWAYLQSIQKQEARGAVVLDDQERLCLDAAIATRPDLTPDFTKGVSKPLNDWLPHRTDGVVRPLWPWLAEGHRHAFPLDFNAFRQILPGAFTIAMLGAIESLLSAVVADGMTGGRHRSNGELVAHGVAVTVIDRFEIVDVDEHHGDLGIAP